MKWSRVDRVHGLFVAAAFVVLVGSAGCGADSTVSGSSRGSASSLPLAQSRVVVPNAAFPVALAAEPDGAFLYAERLTGEVRRVGADGTLDLLPVAVVTVVGADDDQRGLLGLVRDAEGRLVGAWTRPEDGRLVVGRLAVAGRAGPSAVPSEDLIWVGPVSARLANGGHLALASDGSLLIGVGDLLQDAALTDDAIAPNRKVLALDPNGVSSQQPRVLSSGWNNPFALAVGEGGIPWVADNTGGSGPERVGRADRPAVEASPLGGPGAGEVVPSAIVVLAADRLALCTYLGARVEELRILADRVERTGRILAAPCETGLTQLVDGRLVTATSTAILVTTDPI